jgi:alkylation response protein AidB-like acyl-CoA dehydrogenase
VRLVKQYLIHQNGEACIACPMVCTEGLIALLDHFADSPETLRILEHCKEGIDGDFGIGAQFVSEIQGGSDIPAGVLEAVEEDGTWRLYGTKFFCSATHADYALVTGKPPGSEDTAIFAVPAWLPGNKEKEIRKQLLHVCCPVAHCIIQAQLEPDYRNNGTDEEEFNCSQEMDRLPWG